MTASSDIDVVPARRHLDAFLVDNEELETLNARLASFNLFRVLRIERVEIRHSNVLAWLLTPGETHGLGAQFLRRFLSRLLMENEDAQVRLTPAQVELMSFDDVEVYREWKNIDIVARSPAADWCLLIENKIGSKESKGQLVKCKNVVQKELAPKHLIPVFLTLEGDEPSEEAREAGYISLSHVAVLDLCERMYEQHRSRIPRDAATFLEHYLTILRRLTMQDAGLVDLCKTIYRKHREAIDLIVEYGSSSEVMDACEECLRSLVECEFMFRKGSRAVWFLPSEMGTLLPEVPLTEWRFLSRKGAVISRKVPVMCWCQHLEKHGRLYAVIEVGPIADGDLRRRLLTSIKDAGFSIKKHSFAPGAKFTRIASATRRLRVNEDDEPDHDPEYIKQETKSLWEKLWTEGSKITKVLKNFDWE
ncbi:MAG TPA: PD-(D/E)XK nuclease family protein [Phycisphaerae bacterium]|nr:PD-(D/E)XK nuclease family protein [Phycisphaerae bacterium]